MVRKLILFLCVQIVNIFNLAQQNGETMDAQAYQGQIAINSSLVRPFLQMVLGQVTKILYVII